MLIKEEEKEERKIDGETRKKERERDGRVGIPLKPHVCITQGHIRA